MIRSIRGGRLAAVALVSVAACAAQTPSADGLAPGALNRTALRASQSRTIALAPKE